MVNQKLIRACGFVDDWCGKNRITYSQVCDESNVQGLFVYSKQRNLLNKLLEDLEPILDREQVHLETTKVRGGMILSLSIRSISERAKGQEMTFEDRLAEVFINTKAKPVPEKSEDLNEGTFLISAARIVENQLKSATQGMARANQTTLQRQRVGSNKTLGGIDTTLKTDQEAPQATTGTTQSRNAPPTRFENRLSAAFNLTGSTQRSAFERQLMETLDGMATPDGAQPGDLFSKFANALSILGKNMGIGPLQEQLKQQGINWKKSDDGQSIILYVVNASTQAPQPIARISAETLTKPSDFEAQLLNLMDFAAGDAPGSFKLKQQQMQTQEKTVREIAKQMGPQDPNAIEQQVQGLGAQQQPMGQQMPQQVPKMAPSVTQSAGQQAAMPKQPMTM